MNFVATILGIAIMFVVLLDAFEAMVLPRRATRRFRPARYYYRVFWFVWVHLADLFKRRGVRQHFLSIFGPLSLFGLFSLWVMSLILSFALLHWALGTPMGSDKMAPSFGTCAYLSGETFFTLGYGDFSPTGAVGRALSVLEAGIGFGFMAVVIGYLPVLYQAFSRREHTISLLDARAGSPPTAGEMLGRLAQAGALSQIDTLLWEWESWSADLLESQLSFPVLAFYRSQHDNQSWLACLTTILDTCALLLANIVDTNRHQVQVTFAMARHAAVDLSLIFRTPQRDLPDDRLPDKCYRELMAELSESKLRVDTSDESAARLRELRAMYEPFIEALSDYFKFDLPPVALAEVPIDNWQRSPWQQSAPGIGSLPIANPGDHFSWGTRMAIGVNMIGLFAEAPRLLTREIFGNVPRAAQAVFYVVALVAVGLWLYGIVRRVRLWLKGTRKGAPINPQVALRRLVRDVLLQRRVWGRGVASLAHVLLFSGFVVLTIGTTLVCIEHVLADLLGRGPGDPVFHKGVYFGVFELVMDTFGVAFLAGCVMFLMRRVRGVGSFARSPADVAILLLLIAIGVSGYLIEGLRIIREDTPLPGLSPVGYVCAIAFAKSGVGPESAAPIHFALWWTHAAMALGFIAIVPYTRMMHSIAGALNLAIRDHSLGVMQLVSIEEFEATGQIGVAKLADFSYRQLIELDACVSCGRCEDSCPAFAVGKPLSPRTVVQDLVAMMNKGDLDGTIHGAPIAAETLWSCTTCTACADVCPLGISPMRMITDMRRHLIGEGALRGSPAQALQKTERAGNPWGMAASERLAWAKGLDVPVASEHGGFEVLYWVGCAAAYDVRIQKVARSFVRLLQAAKVNFAVLGTEERCTGESARRMGDELLFQQLAEQNVDTLTRRKVQRIVAHCPHCVNSLRNDYPQAGGNYEVLHHSELLNELIQEGRLPRIDGNPASNGATTYHDPCYLARAAGVTEAPRNVLAASANGSSDSNLVELPRNRRATSCCGAGGGRMWFDDKAEGRVGQDRVLEIVGTGATNVAVSCPFCLVMLTDGLAAKKPDLRVRDIAEMLADSVLGPETH